MGVDGIDHGVMVMATTGEVQGAGGVNCYLPLALPDCAIQDAIDDGGTIEDLTLVLNPAGIDNIGWAIPGDAGANADNVKDQLNGNCSGDEAEIGGPVDLNNGVIDKALQILADNIDDSETVYTDGPWDAQPAQHAKSVISNYGNTYEGVIMIFDGEGDYCDEGGKAKWNTTETITGFAWAAVFDVTDGGAKDKNMRVSIDMSNEHDYGSKGGGDDDSNITFTTASRVFY